MTDAVEPEVIFAHRGKLGHVALNRPKAINALNQNMIVLIQRQLDEWATDSSVETVAFTGNGERGFCAGGDIVTLFHDAKEGDGTASEQFWRDEYQLNSTIANYPKATVAFQDGIVLGGGIGITGHSSLRVVTEKSKVGMPETGIGFLPDVGGLWLLSRADNELGKVVALTGSMITGADAIEVNLSDYFVPSEKLPALLKALETEDPKAAVEAAAETAPPSQLAADREWIDAAFSASTVVEIVSRLRATGTEGADKIADAIESKSPISEVFTIEAFNRARSMATVEEALQQDFTVALVCHRSHDFVEGIRAQVIDKDRQPKWQPATLADVTEADIAPYFEPLGDRALHFVGA